VLQVSLPQDIDAAGALRLGQALAPLRERGVLVIGSGSLTHNLYEFRQHVRDPEYAQAFADWVRDAVLRRDVAALVDYRRRAPQAESAHPTEEHFLPDNRVIRSEQSLNESSRNGDTSPQGVPGVRSNTPGPELMQNTPSAAGGAASFEKQDRTVNYEIGKITSRILEPVGRLTRVSVAVMVDGTYRNAPRKGGGTEREYVPRGTDEVQKIETLVKRAVTSTPNAATRWRSSTSHSRCPSGPRAIPRRRQQGGRPPSSRRSLT
jgi:hypothetical protein